MPVETSNRFPGWIRAVGLPLLLLTVYAATSGRTAQQRQRTADAELVSLHAAVKQLEDRKHGLRQQLAVASSTGTSPDPSIARKSVLVQHRDDSPARLYSHLLQSLEEYDLHSLLVNQPPAAPQPSANPLISLELVGSFEQVTLWLQRLEAEVEAIAVHGLRMNLRGAGECSWQVELELRRRLL